MDGVQGGEVAAVTVIEVCAGTVGLGFGIVEGKCSLVAASIFNFINYSHNLAEGTGYLEI